MDHAPDQVIHVILDNYSTHKKNEEWLENHAPRPVSLHTDFSQLVEPDWHRIPPAYAWPLHSDPNRYCVLEYFDSLQFSLTQLHSQITRG